MAFNNGSSSELQSEINITPLVDVVLVLLIIFMVVVPLLVEGYDVDIPRSAVAAEPAQAEELQLVLSIAPAACKIAQPLAGDGLPADCSVMLDDQKILAKELPERVGAFLGGQPPEKRVLFLSVDDSMNYEGVLRIIDLAKSGVGHLKIEFITAQ